MPNISPEKEKGFLLSKLLLVHLRNWPVLIKRFVVDCDDPVLSLGLKLHEVVERMVASEFYPYEIDLLEEKVYQYLDLRKAIRLDYPNLMLNPKPKHHFIRKLLMT